VRAAPLNPLDLKIINSYNTNINRERGIGREYAGVITHVGSKVTDWKVDDEVCGLYLHPNGYGTLSTSILVDPSVDALVLKPQNLSWEEASSWMLTFGTAFQALENVKLSADSHVFVNGGSSSVGMMAIQLLKNSYHVENITASCSGSALSLVQQVGAKLCVNYRVNSDLTHVLDVLTTTGVYKDYNDAGDPIEVRAVPAKKFDLILDCVGGYRLVEKCNSYLASGGSYVTTVGDYHFDYKKDVYNSWNTVSMNARSWIMKYHKVEFDKRPADWIHIGKDMLESGDLTNVIDSTFEWKDYGKAKKKVESGHAHGKVVLKVEIF
jgi:NADPH:quinone reductase-like Zn-dependent oxidoreductase